MADDDDDFLTVEDYGKAPTVKRIKWSYTDKDGVKHIEFEDGLALAALLMAEIVFLNSPWWENPPREDIIVLVNCNDVFAWGCGDAEPLKYKDIEDLYDHWLKDKVNGAEVWCCKQRKQMPQRPVYKDIMSKGIWDLDSMGLEPNHYDTKMDEWKKSKEESCTEKND